MILHGFRAEEEQKRIEPPFIRSHFTERNYPSSHLVASLLFYRNLASVLSLRVTRGMAGSDYFRFLVLVIVVAIVVVAAIVVVQ